MNKAPSKDKAALEEVSEAPATGWTRTTVVVKEDHLEKLKILSWWENTTLKDLFDEMIEQYLSSHPHLDQLLEKRKKNLESKRRSSSEN